MAILVDTGILLRVPNRDGPLHQQSRNVLRLLNTNGEQGVTTLQNMSEFWNVCTRPVAARGGLGLSVEQADRRLRLIERLLVVLPEPQGLYEKWRELVLTHRMLGVQIHDAKLVAAMALHGISQMLTFNDRDFARYSGIKIINP